MYSLASLDKQILDNLHEGVYILGKDRKITYWSKSAELITGFTSEEALSTYYCCDILAHADENGEAICQRQCPVFLTLEDGVTRQTDMFLRHKDGYRLPVSVKVFAIKDEKGEIIGVADAFVDNSPREALFRELEQLKDKTNFDQLTGIYTRRYGDTLLSAKLAEFQKGGRALGILFADIDRFKSVNDLYGHNIGDLVLKTVARTMASSVRTGDYAIRWGGEEIIIVLSGNFDRAGLKRIANKLRSLVQQSEVRTHRETIKVTISIGATLATQQDTVETLVGRADGLMYQSKNAGRNCVTIG